MKVYLLWQNDGVLSVYGTVEGARAAAKEVRDQPRWNGYRWEEICED